MQPAPNPYNCNSTQSKGTTSHATAVFSAHLTHNCCDCRPVLKLFEVDNKEYWGKVIAVSMKLKDVDNSAGPWFRIE